MKKKPRIIFALILIFFYLIFHLFIMKDYGLSWDFHFHFYGGLYHLGLPVPSINSPAPVPFSPPDPRITVADPFGPFISIVPTLSYLTFYEKLHFLPFDVAYNLPGLLFGVLGVAIIFLFLNEAIGFWEGIVASLFLALLPTYFGYLHFNMKDIPNAVFFAAAVYLFWRFTKKTNIRNLIFSAVTFAVAFNWKINSIFVPVICGLWVLLGYFINSISNKLRDSSASLRMTFLYFLLAPFAAIALWWPFWKDPIGKLLEIPGLFSHNTYNMPVLLAGQIFRSGINVPWYYPFVYIGITTPLPILISFILGFIICLKKIRDKTGIFLLLILWFIVPLTRYFLPQNPAIDGMRHFLEVVFPICAIAGVSAVWVLKFVRNKLGKTAVISLSTLVIILLVLPLIKYHPYETDYFNILAGGIKGASGKFDIDFWGTPQKEAAAWLNREAPYGSTVNIVMAQSTAALYLRSDLLKNLNTKSIGESDYVVLLNRQSFFNDEIQNFLSSQNTGRHLVFSKTIDGVALVWVYAGRLGI